MPVYSSAVALGIQFMNFEIQQISRFGNSAQQKQTGDLQVIFLKFSLNNLAFCEIG